MCCGWWPAVLLAGVTARLLLDPGTYDYYTASAMIAALLADVVLRRGYWPTSSIVAFTGLYGIHLFARPADKTQIRFASCTVLLALAGRPVLLRRPRRSQMNWARTCATTEQLSVYSVYLLDKTRRQRPAVPCRIAGRCSLRDGRCRETLRCGTCQDLPHAGFIAGTAAGAAGPGRFSRTASVRGVQDLHRRHDRDRPAQLSATHRGAASPGDAVQRLVTSDDARPGEPGRHGNRRQHRRLR